MLKDIWWPSKKVDYLRVKSFFNHLNHLKSRLVVAERLSTISLIKISKWLKANFSLCFFGVLCRDPPDQGSSKNSQTLINNFLHSILLHFFLVSEKFFSWNFSFDPGPWTTLVMVLVVEAAGWPDVLRKKIGPMFTKFTEELMLSNRYLVVQEKALKTKWGPKERH